jgi:hypothetical protein
MKRISHALIGLLVLSHLAIAQTKPPLLPEPVVAALSAELSGETAKRNLEYISRHHRMRVPAPLRAEAMTFFANEERIVGEVPRLVPAQGEGRTVFRRNPSIKGPMSVFGYDYFTDHYGAERVAGIRLLGFRGLRGTGDEYAYEALNLVDGKRTAQEIGDAVSAIYGPVPLDVILEYLRALQEIKVIEVDRLRE